MSVFFFGFYFFFCYASSIRKLLYPCPSLSDIKETNMMAVNVRKILLPFSKRKEMVSFSQLDVRGMSFYHLYLSNENFWCLSWLQNGTECTLWHILSCFATKSKWHRPFRSWTLLLTLLFQRGSTVYTSLAGQDVQSHCNITLCGLFL